MLHRSLVEGPASSRLLARDLLPLLRDGEYEEGFTMALATKDLRLAVDLARSAGVPAELSAVVEQLFTRTRAVFGDDAGEMTPVRLYEETAGVLLRLPDGGQAAGGTSRRADARQLTGGRRRRRAGRLTPRDAARVASRARAGSARRAAPAPPARALTLGGAAGRVGATLPPQTASSQRSTAQSSETPVRPCPGLLLFISHRAPVRRTAWK